MKWDDRIGARLKLRDLHIFMTVVQQGGVGRAAKHLAVSQPVISKALSDLESVLRVRLLDRTPKGTEPTAYGRAVVRWGSIVFDDVRSGIKEIELLADPAGGEVRIASSETLNANFVPTVIGRLINKFPRLVYNVLQETEIAGLCSLLRERRVDLVVSLLPETFEYTGLDIDVLFSDRISVAAGPDSKWVRRRKIEPAELLDEPWLLPSEDTDVTSILARAFRKKGLSMPRRVIATNSIHLLQVMAMTGHVLCFTSTMRSKLSGFQSFLKPVPVDLDFSYSDVGIVTLKNRTMRPAAQLFIDCARDLAKSMTQPRPNVVRRRQV
jgi:DNA-binding transcriptional LysR family regulator